MGRFEKTGIGGEARLKAALSRRTLSARSSYDTLFILRTFQLTFIETGSAMDQTDTPRTKTSSNHSFLLVGIGASAGGVQALKDLFASIPADSGMAYVVILHLSQQFESNLDTILQNQTKMPVLQVSEPIKVQPNHVYVIPPGKFLELVDGIIRLDEPERVEGKRISIDHFFRTLADTYGRRAVCIILSGTGTDGTLGLKQIKERNGFAIVQDPEDAAFDGMPRSAIATGLADVVLPLDQIAQKLLFVRDSTQRFHLIEDNDKKITEQIKGSETLREILTLLRIRTGNDFSNYKQATILRRIARHLQIHELDNMPDYLNLLREHPKEVDFLLHNLLINVTNFFRDKESFEALESIVIPKLFEGKTAQDTVRVWIPGCASGEEAYSLAILLTEYANKLSQPPKLQVFASDIDDEAIAEGRLGTYTKSIVIDVSEERLRRFFIKEAEGYRVRKEIRELILFAPHNILRDPPFSRLDLVSCRNVLIYLNRDTQGKVLQLFHFALQANSYLFLGSSESTEGSSSLFTPIDKKHRIYMRTHASSLIPVQPVLSLSANRQLKGRELPSAQQEKMFSFGELHLRLIEQYAPPSILVNEDFDIVHLSEHAGRYLQHAGGEPTNSLLKVVHSALRSDLRAAMFSAQQGGVIMEIKDIPIELDGQKCYVNLTLHKIGIPESVRGFMLVLFEEHTHPFAPISEKEQKQQRQAGESALEEVVQRLEEELQRTKERLRNSIEQYETSLEELKASNEELQAINEELRSATEELETNKEELQSVNEELTTVNYELKETLDEMSRANSDLQNLMISTNIATIFLDRHLQIKRFTPEARKLFNIILSDAGRPLSHLTNLLEYQGLNDDANEVLKTLQTIEREVKSTENRWYIARLLPYRTLEDRIDGVVITFVDITSRRAAEEKMRKSDQRFRAMVNQTTVGIALTDLKGKFTFVNDHYSQIVGYSPKELMKLQLKDIIYPEDVASQQEKFQQMVQTGTPFTLEKRYVRKDGSLVWVSNSITLVRDEQEKAEYAVAVSTDISALKQVEQDLRNSEESLRLILASVEDYAIFTTDLEGIITRWNKGAENTFGYTEEEAIGQPVARIFTPEDRANGAPAKEMKQALHTGRALDERWHLRKDGSRFYASGVMSLLHDGSLHGFVKIARDLTQQKQAEEALRDSAVELERQSRIFDTTLSSITDFAYIFDREGRFLYSNQALLDLLGMSLKEIIGKNFFDLPYPRDLAARLQQQIQEVIDKKTIVVDETPYTNPTGLSGYYEYIFSPVIAADGSVDVVAGSTRETTARKQMEETLRDADRKKNEFLATLAHELRNPLTPITAALKVLDRNQEEVQTKEAREIIGRQVRKIVILVDDLLEISRITRGKVRLKKQNILLSEVMADAIETVDPLMKAAGHRFTMHPLNEPLYLYADPDRIAQVVVNLLTNSIKYTPPGGEISLSVAKENKHAVIRVKDNGVGIPWDRLENIFELFNQVEQPGRELQSGLGIGLNLVKTLVEMHGGTIVAYSQGEGKGSEFLIHLPLAKKQRTNEKFPPINAINSAEATKKATRILVVDDEEDITDVIKTLLEMEGKEVETANTGESAIEVATTFKPEAALVDIGLLDIDGYEVARRLRAAYPAIFLIAHSGWGAEEDRQRTREAGFDYHLVKPAELEEIMEVLEKGKIVY